jgi:predicted dehydrogenase
MLNNYGAHTLDQVLQLIGYDVKRLFCSLRIVASVGDAEDVVKVVLETKDGAIGEVDINQASPTNPYFIEVYGTRGTITLPPDDITRFTVRHLPPKGVPARKLDPSLATPGRKYPDGVASFREEVIRVDARRGVDVYADLAQAISTGRPPFVRPEEPLAVLKLIDRCKDEAGQIRRTSLFASRKSSVKPRTVRAKA